MIKLYFRKIFQVVGLDTYIDHIVYTSSCVWYTLGTMVFCVVGSKNKYNSLGPKPLICAHASKYKT